MIDPRAIVDPGARIAEGVQIGPFSIIGAGVEIETGTVFMNRADYLDPALVWTGCKETGKGGSLSVLGFQNLTRPKSYHLKKAL